MVFLRGQSLNYRRQVAFAERLGPLTLGHPTLASPPGQPLLEEIDSLKGGKVNYWHTDVTFVDRPPAFTLLHAMVIPPVGGDTLWANTVSAYQSLPPELRDLADRLRVLHTNDFDYARTFNRGERVDPALAAAHEEFVSTVYETEHPLVRVHPETSERSLVLGGFARSRGAFTPQASRDLIRLLQDYITRPENTVRWQLARRATWPSGTTAPPSTTRSRTTATAHRRGERVTVAGPVPVGWTAAPASRSRATPRPTTPAARTTEGEDTMSTSAETSTPARKGLPVYKRRRRRIYGAAALVLAVIVGVVVWATTGGSSGPAAQLHHLGQPGLGGQPGQHHREPAVAGQAHPREAEVRAVRGRGDRDRGDEERCGAGHQRGRQPAGDRGHRQRHRRDRGHGLGFRRRPAAGARLGDVAGPAGRKSVGVLVGSSEDYELLGYLALQHLTGKVKAVPFPDENAAGAAALSGAVDAAYVYGSPATKLLRKGYHSLVNARRSPSSASPA